MVLACLAFPKVTQVHVQLLCLPTEHHPCVPYISICVVTPIPSGDSGHRRLGVFSKTQLIRGSSFTQAQWPCTSHTAKLGSPFFHAPREALPWVIGASSGLFYSSSFSLEPFSPSEFPASMKVWWLALVVNWIQSRTTWEESLCKLATLGCSVGKCGKTQSTLSGTIA